VHTGFNMSVCPLTCISLASIRRIYMKFHVGDLVKTIKSPDLVKILQKYRAVYMNN